MLEIPPLWQAFFEQQVLAKIPNKISDDVYAVYTDFDREVKDPQDIYNLGYTLVIGAAVSSAEHLDATLVSTVIPPTTRAVFAVEPALPAQVGAQWFKIWQMPELKRLFAPDYEHYSSNGEINILISVAE